MDRSGPDTGGSTAPEDPGPTRRAVLVAGLLLPLVACTRESDDPGPPQPPGPDVALRSAAAAREQQLLDLYDAALAAGLAPDRAVALQAVRAEHAVHLAALVDPEEAPATPPPTTPTTTAPTTTAPTTNPPASPAGLPQLRAAEAAGAAAHAEAVLGASRGLAAVLASLAASETSHALVLA